MRDQPASFSFRHLLVFALLLATATPVLAFRMLQHPGQGRQDDGFFSVECDDPGGFIHWNTREIFWRRNVQGFGANAVNALYWARVEWGSESDFILRDGGNTTAGFATDGQNVTIWQNGGLCSGSCLAATVFVLGPGQEILETDITFNADKRWRTDGRNRRKDRDVQSVATHEYGHSLGIFHSEILTNPQPTMRPLYDHFRLNGRTIEADDRDAIACIDEHYPFIEPGCTGPPAATNGISGNNYNHCDGTTEEYTTSSPAGAERYRWEVLGTWWNQTSDNPRVFLFPNFGTGVFTFRVRAENDCGVSAWRETPLVIHPIGTGPCF